ncbi:hypothetical protein [Sphingobacterium paucimobilis]|uniref:Uncharacterized protein n=1 Tax=Sphingobacterium paucimobilis HER1398 TaxID=1346330 RepID=U2HXR8_9SPHI|nr:hypothetical protein [Sphingobacterium paucimobilis]ERJ60030.1 hypothetical protein M472_14795 [Sphingobacterium paucimobilis HER1398]
MKKYLSKTYLVGVIALTLAFGLQSFQKAQVNEKAANTEEMVWFPANNPELLPETCDRNAFNTSNGTTVEPALCTPLKEYCCAIGYPISECDEIAPGVYQLKSSVTHLGQVIKFDI